jgi:hypothetical protein
MLGIDVFFSILLVGFWVYCVLDVLVTDRKAVRNLPKIAWLLIVLVLNPVGGAAWLFAGRPRATAAGSPDETPARQGPRWPVMRMPNADAPGRLRRDRAVAPDDDPEFLAGLAGKPRDSGKSRESRSDEQLLRDWEADLRSPDDGPDDAEPPATAV